MWKADRRLETIDLVYSTGCRRFPTVANDVDRTPEGRVSSDRETIRSWADRHAAVPVRETGTGTGEGVRFVPERDVGESHERIEWEAFFTELETGDRVVVVLEPHEHRSESGGGGRA